MLSHRTLMHNVIGGAVWGHGGPEAVGLGVVPVFHITGFVYGALGSVAAGSTTVILPRWARELAGRLIARHEVSRWTCIPTMIIDLFGSPIAPASTCRACAGCQASARPCRRRWPSGCWLNVASLLPRVTA